MFILLSRCFFWLFLFFVFVLFCFVLFCFVLFFDNLSLFNCGCIFDKIIAWFCSMIYNYWSSRIFVFKNQFALNSLLTKSIDSFQHFPIVFDDNVLSATCSCKQLNMIPIIIWFFFGFVDIQGSPFTNTFNKPQESIDVSRLSHLSSPCPIFGRIYLPSCLLSRALQLWMTSWWQSKINRRGIERNTSWWKKGPIPT